MTGRIVYCRTPQAQDRAGGGYPLRRRGVGRDRDRGHDRPAIVPAAMGIDTGRNLLRRRLSYRDVPVVDV